MIKKTKTQIFIISLIILIIIVCCLKIKIYNIDISVFPVGEKIDSVTSENGKYTMNLYFIDGGPISADADRIEILDNQNNKKWNLYYEEKGNLKEYKWINNNTVSINNKKINIYKEKYHLD